MHISQKKQYLCNMKKILLYTILILTILILLVHLYYELVPIIYDIFH